MALKGAANPNWRGGRTITPDGYVLVRVGKEHPAADCRGYAYEHRLVASNELQRTLTRKEQVHHLDHRKNHNDTDNLVVMATAAEHRALHRGQRSKRRLPTEPNYEVACQCGCGTTFLHFASSGRPRHYVSGHNPQNAATQTAILDAVANGVARVDEFVECTKAPRRSIITTLSTLVRDGRIARIAYGVYGPLGSQPLKTQVRWSCACGCNRDLDRYDRYGRERRFISGHNRRKR